MIDRRALWVGFGVATVVGVAGWIQHIGDVDAIGEGLESVAAEAAAGIDGAAHETVRTGEEPAFFAIRSQLRESLDRHDIRSPIYTLRADAQGTAFVVMTNEVPYVGSRYVLRQEMELVFAEGARAHTGLYRDDHGAWVSGYAPVKDASGSTVALVEVDRPGESLYAARWRVFGGSFIAGFVSWLAAALGFAVAAERKGPLAAIRRVATGRLANRIGLGSAVAVVVAAGIITVLDYRDAHEDLLRDVTARLDTAVRVAARNLDAEAHASITTAADPAFEPLRRQLRVFQQDAGISSPVYTLRRDGERTRFVVMTNEDAFVGDPHELRPSVRATFDGGGPGHEGPYTDAHGTWISAWAPIGNAEAVLQADVDVEELVAALRIRTMRRAMVALIATAVAVVAGAILARGIARPVREIATAAAKVQSGDFSARVREDRLDEVGDLARAVNRMAGGLAEREKLRNMFGKYMASQVVTELLERGELTLAGEEREVTVMISDIRGFTPLTERLGAAEIVALLNEYFSVLVDVVIRNDGVIDKFMGDAMLCYFGAPVPQPDHRARAVRAGAGMLEALREWNARRAAAGLPTVATGVGIASGRVIVGNIGSPQRLEYTAIGDAVNLASRLCGKAEAGQIVVSDNVRQAVEDDRFVAMGPVSVKGMSQPIEVHRLVVG